MAKTKQELANEEYTRLKEIYARGGVDEVKLDAYDRYIRKVAELYAQLEAIKDLPSVIVSKSDATRQIETAAGKMRVKYMAQYTSATQKLNRELLGGLSNDDDGDLDDYE
ncbi:MAG: hypothetical protein ACLTAN_00095 [Christensenellaceae bacterium]